MRRDWENSMSRREGSTEMQVRQKEQLEQFYSQLDQQKENQLRVDQVERKLWLCLTFCCRSQGNTMTHFFPVRSLLSLSTGQALFCISYCICTLQIRGRELPRKWGDFPERWQEARRLQDGCQGSLQLPGAEQQGALLQEGGHNLQKEAGWIKYTQGFLLSYWCCRWIATGTRESGMQCLGFYQPPMLRSFLRMLLLVRFCFSNGKMKYLFHPPNEHPLQERAKHGWSGKGKVQLHRTNTDGGFFPKRWKTLKKNVGDSIIQASLLF